MSTLNDTIGVVLELLQDLDTPRSLTVKILIDHEEWDQLASLSVDPAHYLTADSYHADATATSILKKCKLPGVKESVKKQRAFDLWLEAERLCTVTNRRFSHFCSGYYPDVDGRIVEYLHRVKSRIARVLGRLPSDLYNSKFGKGATYRDVGRNCTVLHKMQSQPTITEGAQCLLSLIEDSAWMRAVVRRESSTPAVVRGNRFTTVPKTARVDRSIAVEPSINIYFQLGVGQAIRRRLKHRANIDLDEGQELHRALAQVGSITDALATLDLSSASDTVAKEVVRFLLPDDWYSLLESLRSPTSEVNNRVFKNGLSTSSNLGVYRLEKFSSMGNGFTFELETLIFWAICSELAGDTTCVYGDDMIVPADAALDCIGALNFFGFVVNENKSYVSGRFRESCGGDYFDGFNVRPFFLKELPHEPQQWMAFANGLYRLNREFSHACGCFDHRIRRAYLRCLGYLPSDIRRLKGPPELGDVCLSTDDISSWRIRIKKGIRYVEVYQPVVRPTSFLRFDPDVQLAAALYGIQSTGALSRDSVSGYRRRWVPYS